MRLIATTTIEDITITLVESDRGFEITRKQNDKPFGFEGRTTLHSAMRCYADLVLNEVALVTDPSDVSRARFTIELPEF